MANLTYAQLMGVWLQAAAGTQYATQSWAALMAAIAEAESGGNPSATNPTDNNGTQTSWGLWQISLGNHNQPSPNWNNPVVNAQLAIGKLQSQGLSAWGTYDSGAYKAYLSGSTTPDTSQNYSADVAAAGSAATAATTQASLTAATTADQNCAWGIGVGWGAGAGFLGGFLSGVTGGATGGSSAQVCLISKTEIRAVAAWVLFLSGAMVMSIGMVVILGSAGISAAETIARNTLIGRGASGVARAVSAAGISAAASPAPAPAPLFGSAAPPPGSTFSDEAVAERLARQQS